MGVITVRGRSGGGNGRLTANVSRRIMTGKKNASLVKRCCRLGMKLAIGRSSWMLWIGMIALFSLQLVQRAYGSDRGIRIGIVGDQTLSRDIQASYGVLRQGVAALSRQKLDVVLHVGDLTESSNTPEVETALFKQAAGILDQLPVPWYLTAGDHDVNPPVFRQDSPDRSRERLFQRLYGERVPAFATHPWYSFDLKGYHFISLYSCEALWSDSRFGDIFLSQVFDDQFTFLKSDLAAHARAKAMIVWVHQPLWYQAGGWKRVHELLRKYPVAAVISGHFHYSQDAGIVDGIHYFTVGATGGLKKNGNRQAGNVDHVSVLSIAGRHHVRLELLALDGQPLLLAPRVDMDRVQALDVQLGNLFDFSKHNPVYGKNGRLVNDCDSARPATIRINEIGNPIDLPLDVQISPATEGLSFRNAAFAADACEQVISGTECVLARTARTVASNNSEVNIDTSAEPLWTSDIVAPAQPGDGLSFDVRTKFRSAEGEFLVQTTISTVVRACP